NEIQVHQMPGIGEAQLHQRNETLPASQQFGLFAELRQHRHCLPQRTGAVVMKGTWVHDFVLGPRLSVLGYSALRPRVQLWVFRVCVFSFPLSALGSKLYSPLTTPRNQSSTFVIPSRSAWRWHESARGICSTFRFPRVWREQLARTPCEAECCRRQRNCHQRGAANCQRVGKHSTM